MPATLTSPDAPTAPKLARVQGVEIFRSGTHRQKVYTEADLDAMVQNFNACKGTVDPPVVVGHEEYQELMSNTGIPAVGRVENVRRKGKVLLADFCDVNPKIARFINQRAYSKVSSEVYDEPPDGCQDKAKGKMLRRVALLGGELPEIKSLADLPLATFAEKATARLRMAGMRDLGKGVWAVFSEIVKHKESSMNPDTPADDTTPADPRAQLAAMLGIDPTLLQGVPDEAIATVLAAMQANPGTDAAGGDAPAPPDGQMAEGDDEEEMKKKGLLQQFAALTGDQLEAMWAKVDDAGEKGTTKAGQSAYDKSSMRGKWSEDEEFADQPGAVRTATTPSNGSPAPTSGNPNPHPKSVTVTQKYAEQQRQLAAKYAELERFAEQQLAANKKALVKTELDALVAAGKVLPSERDGGLDDVLFAADSAKVMKFAEKGKVVEKTAFDLLLGTLKKRPVLMSFSERCKDPVRNGREHEEAETAKVQRFSETAQFANTLAKAGKTPESYVKTFQEYRKKNPAITAEKYGVPAEYARN